MDEELKNWRLAAILAAVIVVSLIAGVTIYNCYTAHQMMTHGYHEEAVGNKVLWVKDSAK